MLGLCGSLRKVSANRAFLEAARELAPPELDIVIHDGLGRLPLFNPDEEIEPLPPVVAALREAVAVSDVLLIACPEYAHGIPGPFKNLLDWLVGSLEFPGKAVLQVNTSGRESHHAQAALREVLLTMSAHMLAAEPLPVPLPGAGCDCASVLDDPGRRRSVQAVLSALMASCPSPAGG